jgi:hypothetical protein
MGHGDFAAYHEWFNNEDVYLLCCCSARKTLFYFLFYYIAKKRLPLPLGLPFKIIPYLLGTLKGAAKLATRRYKTHFFEDICTRYPLP